MDPLTDPDLPELVSSALEMRDQGMDPSLEELCRARPDLIDAVRQSILESERLPGLQLRSASHDGLAGRVLGERYRLEARLGSGAMGVVYRARDLELARTVAVKVLRDPLLQGEQAEPRFIREAEVLAAIQHPAVVTIHDRGRTDDGAPYLVMELLQGLPLCDLLELAREHGTLRRPDSGWMAEALGAESLEEASALRMAVRWCADLASGLAAAHRAGVFHRDVKPSNVFLRRDGRSVLLDFGLAARTSHATLTNDETTLGTPAYMAPESLHASHRPTPAVDVYGLTATLYHLVTGAPPFQGTPSQILAALVTQDARPARALRPDLPRDLQAILDHGMARRPQDRYAGAEELERDLRAFLDHRPVRARPLSPLTRTWRRARRTPWFLPVAAVLAGVLALGVGRSVRDDLRERRSARFRELWSHVPANLGLLMPENRVLSALEGREEVRRLLADAQSASDDPLPAGVVRAAFLLDHGDPRTAADAMAAVADAHPSAYARALAQRYAAVPPDARGSAAVDLEGLPDPEQPTDAYLAAFHAMRAGRYGEVRRLLEAPGVERIPAAQELSLLLSSSDPVKMYEQTTRLEASVGGRSAMTAHLIGLALIFQKQYERARTVIAEGLALAPMSQTQILNAGLCAWRLGDLDAARRHYELCVTLKPQHLLGHENLVRVLMDAGELDAARAALAEAPYGEDDGGRGARRLLEGEIGTERALASWVAKDEAHALLEAERALEAFAEARRLGTEVKTPRTAIASALLEGDTERVFEGLSAMLANEPENWKGLEVLLNWLPEELDRPNTSALGRYLRALHRSFSVRSARDATPVPSR